MKIGVVTEFSTAAKNEAVVSILEDMGHEVINAGMSNRYSEPQLSYLHTGIISAALLHLDLVDFVVGGCGTGQGYFNVVTQFPGIFCGLLQDPLDAWLYAQVNGGNCVSLCLNKGFGWAGEVNIRFMLERLFSTPLGQGYPPERAHVQRDARQLLSKISSQTHYPVEELYRRIDRTALQFALGFGDMPGLIAKADDSNPLKAVLTNLLKQEEK